MKLIPCSLLFMIFFAIFTTQAKVSEPNQANLVNETSPKVIPLSIHINEFAPKIATNLTKSTNQISNNHITKSLDHRKTSLSVLSLNLAHGRKTSFSQFFVSGKKIKQNIIEIGHYLNQKNADIVFLQEADLPSRWSGKFNHIELLAHTAGYQYFVATAHVDNYFGVYGTAILSKLPINEAIGVTFLPTPPTTNKGFSLVNARIYLADNRKVDVDFVSLHLDFLRKSTRKEQLIQLSNILNKRSFPIIVAGDFNSDWLGKEQVVNNFVSRSNLHAFSAKSAEKAFHTYGKKRIDWIFLSNELEFTKHWVDSVKLSDHKPLIAKISLEKL